MHPTLPTELAPYFAIVNEVTRAARRGWEEGALLRLANEHGAHGRIATLIVDVALDSADR